MKFIISFSLVLFISSCSSSTKIDCNLFKHGEFKYNAKESNSVILITRSDSIQTELNESTGLTDTMKIIWTDSCTYNLIDLSLSNKYPHVPDSILKIPLETKILRATSDYYIFEARKEGVSLIYRDTVWRVK
jgi:hypothetical protein